MWNALGQIAPRQTENDAGLHLEVESSILLNDEAHVDDFDAVTVRQRVVARPVVSPESQLPAISEWVPLAVEGSKWLKPDGLADEGGGGEGWGYSSDEMSDGIR